MLDLIRTRLLAAKIPLSITWLEEITEWGTRVALYRDYAAGDHRAKMTPEMREMLRISDAKTDQFSMNYCDLIIQRMNDRLTVTGIEGDTDAATEWSADMLDYNRFDGLQMDVTEATLRDGTTFIMSAYDNEVQQPILAHELAWDGVVGTIPIYDRMGRQMIAAVKVWFESDENRRVNIYYPNRVERFQENKGANDLAPLMTVDPLTNAETNITQWVDVAGNGVGIPIVAFVNRAKPRSVTGISELANAIPLQDALNRTLVSMVMVEELSAFQIKVADGFDPPAGVTPGMWLSIPAHEGQTAKAYVLEQAQLVPFIQQAEFLIDQIGTITNTPLPAQMGGDTSSGEALKQRETGLLGKIKRFQIKGGNAWEDVVSLAARVQSAFGTVSPPSNKRWSCEWQDAEIRNEAETLDSIVKVQSILGEAQALREVAAVLKWDEHKIQEVEALKRTSQAQSLAALGGNLPGFDQFVIQ